MTEDGRAALVSVSASWQRAERCLWRGLAGEGALASAVSEAAGLAGRRVGSSEAPRSEAPRSIEARRMVLLLGLPRVTLMGLLRAAGPRGGGGGCFSRLGRGLVSFAANASRSERACQLAVCKILASVGCQMGAHTHRF